MSTNNSGSGKLISAGVLVGLFLLSVIALVVWRLAWVTLIDNYEFGFVYHKVSGKIEVINRTGYVVYNPFVTSVHTIDLRPYQITITPAMGSSSSTTSSGTGGSSIGARVLNAKLVRFNPQGLSTFLEWHGRDAADDNDNMLTILKAYAFDRDEGRDCPFLTIVTDMAPSSNRSTNTVAR